MLHPVVPFSQNLRSKALTLHGTSQLTKDFTKSWRDQEHFVQYLVRRQTMHRALDHVMAIDTGLLGHLQADLTSLDLDWRRRSVTDNLYADYVMKLDTREKLVAHYYAFVLAHVAGGGPSIVRSAASVLPAWFIPNSWYFNLRDRELLTTTIVQDINDETCYWTNEQAQTCLDELDKAFCFGLQIIHQ
jgi:hypothetical protein